VEAIGAFSGTMPLSDGRGPADEQALAAAMDRLNEFADRGFARELLHDPEGARGSERVRAQYLRVFAGAADRFPQAPPGSIEVRRRPGEAIAANLALAGD
jgi:hypothetical protein